MTANSPMDPTRGLQGPAPLDRTAGGSRGGETQEGPSFAEILEDSIREVADLKEQADVAIQDLAQGKTENVSEVLTAVEKADLAFRALMSIRSKLVDAYEEINRLRV